VRVQEIMTQEVSCGSPATNAAEAAEIMWTKNCGVLPIVADGGHVVGIVTDRDLFIALGTQNRRPADLQMREIMREDPIFCAPGDDVRQALKIMAKQRVCRLPVVDELGGLQGILSVDDVLARTDGAVKDDAVQALEAISEHHMTTMRDTPSVARASA